MSFPTTPLWRLMNGFLVWTADTTEHGFETMVFPAQQDASEHISRFLTYVEGVDYEHPLEEYTLHYATVAEARKGHDETVTKVRNLRRIDNATKD